MGREIVYCSQCGDRITSSDLDKGRGAMVLKRYFCKKCVKNVIDKSDPEPDATDTPPLLRTRPVRALSGANSRARLHGLLPYFIAVGIGVVAIGLLLFILFAKQGH